MATIEERVRKIIAVQLATTRDEVRPGRSLADDLDANDVDMAEIVMVLEEEFGVEISEEESGKLITVDAVISYITDAMAEV